MTIMRYGFFGEDEAQRLFLHHYLEAIAVGQAWRFEADEAFTRRFRGQNKTRVNDLFDEVCEIGFREYWLQCFFVGLDLDDFDAAAFQVKQTEMRCRLHERGIEAILLIPVQCIEHWLWYLRWRMEHPRSTKNERLETQPRENAKLAVYNAKKCSTKHSNPIVAELSAGMEIEWLASRSTSFLAFHTQVQSYLAALL